MAPYDYDIVVLGGGAAGLTVASGAAQLGAKTVLIEEEPLLGGDCLHYGCVPSKTLIKSAKVYHQIKNTADLGLPVITPPPVNFEHIAARIQRVKDHIQVHDSVERFESLGVSVRFGHARFADDHSVEVDGRRITGKKIVLATGSSAFLPNINGIKEAGVLTNRDIFTLSQLPQNLVILGGGAIALEMAQAFCRFGSRVTVIQRSSQVLSREDADVATLIQKRLELEGVNFFLNSEVMEIKRTGEGKKSVHFVSSGFKQSVSADYILAAYGRSANVHQLGLDAVGVAVDRGVVVDSRLRTSQKHIYAAGDVTGDYQFTHAAGYEGGVVISNAVLRFPRKTDYTWMPWCTYTSPELASIGMNEKRAQQAGIEYSVVMEEFSNNDRAVTENDTDGMIKLLLDKKGKPLGVQILGSVAGESLSQWVGVFNGGVKLSSMAGGVMPYPTFSEINKRVVGKIYGEKLFSDKVRKILRFFFHYRG